MKMPGERYTTVWNVGAPPAACVLLLYAAGSVPGAGLITLLAAALIASVLTAVHHAEVVAHRVGEPFGTLVLALCVTIIEVALIVSVMLSGEGDGKEQIARDTLFAAIMIVCNGIVGLAILLGGIRHGTLEFRVEGTNPALAVLTALATLTLVLPNFTISSPGPYYTDPQLEFAGLSSLVLYGTFVFIQTVRHRDYFLPSGDGADDHAALPTTRVTAISGILLFVSLIAVVGLAKLLSPSIEAAVHSAGAPRSIVGIAIALLVLLPEGLAATRAALANRLQTAFNLALGSALASIGLTIPVVVLISILFGLPLTLGPGPLELVLLMLTIVISVLTLAIGRTTVLHGVVHLVIFAAYIFLTIVP